MRIFRLLLAATVSVATVSLIAAPSQPAAAAIGQLTFSDEFNGPAGAAPDGSKWRHDIGGSGWGNNELQYYTNRTDNVAQNGAGQLVITARRNNPANFGCWYGTCEYTSGKLTTSATFTQTYGRFEARMKLPRGQGMWPAFWMLGNNIGDVGWPASGEIDIMENIGREPTRVHGSTHSPNHSGGNPLTGTYTLPGGQQFPDDFHTFTVDWEPGVFTWYVDGIQYSRHVRADVGGDPWPFDHPFFMMMNLAVGGNWPGSPDGSTVFPQTLQVDWVRAYAYTSSPGGRTGQITGLANKCVDVAAASSADGTAVQLYTCNGTNAQQWTVGSDGTIRALGKCLDVAAAGTADGTRVQLYTCNGSGAQRWTITGARDIVNPASNKCLDVTGNNSADSTPLQIWTCGGGANQKWTAP
ncbi:glycoside hydrolase family 16 protein [Tenggerimyces flavus]|uniref:RICIN domain-containing protein n=1 Tax=Tenggerimyces flavus TaxID=1708749 RepID=A0ABV7YFX0_9ACTN|nr:glycoside hydrolase family 16 protein [Tenggerimyces flavus]MBM7784269.1 beta-glucanase (GH16 family) [Tenggerimyces flavus]